MNYLETGLPHTQFYRKKTQFSPPRFIPLCGLSRKYQGLEPLSRKEEDVLVRRLSEPKKSQDAEDQICVAQVRPRSSPGSGRFVGQKKMSSLEIEQMVSRLCSRRPTKEYPFVDDTIEAEDIMRMTDRMNDSSDSEDEANTHSNEPEVDKNNYVFRRHSSAASMRSDCEKDDTSRREMTHSKYKRHNSAFTRPNESCFDNSSNKSWDSSAKYKSSHRNLRTHFDISDTGSRRESNSSMKKIEPVKSWAVRVSSERGMKEGQDIAKFKPELKYRPTVSFSRGSYFSAYRGGIKSNKSVEDKNNIPQDHEETEVTEITIKRPMSHPGNMPSYKYEREPSADEKKIDLSAMFASISKSCRAAELTRPPPSLTELFPPSKKKEPTPEVKPNTPKPTKTVSVPPNNIPAEIGTEIVNSLIQADPNRSPRSKFPRLEENRSKRFTEKPNDDLLIDQVASYNRSLKFRSKR